jgi:hypothetical protein
MFQGGIDKSAPLMYNYGAGMKLIGNFVVDQ